MPRKSYKKYGKNNKTKKIRKTRRIRRKYCKKGGTNEVNCCMCEKKVNTNKTLIPLECLNKYGSRAHRICSDCWWDPEEGFAREGIKHSCPGCMKNFPLTKDVSVKKSEAPVQIIDLKLDDD